VDQEYKGQAIITQEREKKNSTFAFPVWIVPTSANTPWLFGAFFKTRIVLTNPTNLTFDVASRVYGPNGVVGTGQTDLPANSSKVWDDFLGTAFGYTGPAAIEFDSWFIPIGGSSDFDFAVTAEVYASDQFRRPPKRAASFMSLYTQRSACLTEQTIALRNGLEYPNEFFQEFQALGLPGLF
jgi:hypothetical protein